MQMTKTKPYAHGSEMKLIMTEVELVSHAPIPETTNATGTSRAATMSAPLHGTVMLAILIMLAPANRSPPMAPTRHTTLLIIKARCILVTRSLKSYYTQVRSAEGEFTSTLTK